MPAHRKPTEVLENNGAFKKDPQRRRNVGPKSESPLGNPPSYFKDDEKAVWRELSRTAPQGVLTAGDRFIVEIIARYLAKFRRPQVELTGPELGKLMSGLSLLGLTPSDRSRIVMSVPDDSNQFEGF